MTRLSFFLGLRARHFARLSTEPGDRGLFPRSAGPADAPIGLFYVRFMDDILVLAPTRWKLRRAVTVVNQVLGSLRLEKHPDKTLIGRTEREGSPRNGPLGPAVRGSDTTLPPTASRSWWARWPTSSTVRPGFMSKSGKGRKAPPRSGPTSSEVGLGERRISRACSGPRDPAGRSGQARPPRRLPRRANIKRARAPPAVGDWRAQG
jgi:hypothetical protein